MEKLFLTQSKLPKNLCFERNFHRDLTRLSKNSIGDSEYQYFTYQPQIRTQLPLPLT